MAFTTIRFRAIAEPFVVGFLDIGVSNAHLDAWGPVVWAKAKARLVTLDKFHSRGPLRKRSNFLLG